MSTGKSTMRNYEAVVVVDPRLDEPAISQAVDRFTKVIGSKGEVTRLDRWGRRRLAYEINHLTEGFYVVAAFKAEPSLVSELDRLFEIGEEYIRAKVVRVP
jgi:small subunit ribosomal protein S6